MKDTRKLTLLIATAIDKAEDEGLISSYDKALTIVVDLLEKFRILQIKKED